MPCNLIDWYGNSSFITDFFDITLHQGLHSSLLDYWGKLVSSIKSL